MKPPYLGRRFCWKASKRWRAAKRFFVSASPDSSAMPAILSARSGRLGRADVPAADVIVQSRLSSSRRIGLLRLGLLSRGIIPRGFLWLGSLGLDLLGSILAFAGSALAFAGADLAFAGSAFLGSARPVSRLPSLPSAFALGGLGAALSAGDDLTALAEELSVASSEERAVEGLGRSGAPWLPSSRRRGKAGIDVPWP